MSAIVADLGLLPDDDRLRPRVWIGHAVTARAQFRDEARKPAAPTGPVEFWFKGPGNVLVSLAGATMPGQIGAYTCSYQPPTTGEWAMRVSGGGESPPLEWVPFIVTPEPPTGPAPGTGIWLTTPDTAVISMQGTHLAGVTIGELDGLGDPTAGDVIPGVRQTPDGPVSGHLRWVDLKEAAEDAAGAAGVAAVQPLVKDAEDAAVAAAADRIAVGQDRNAVAVDKTAVTALREDVQADRTAVTTDRTAVAALRSDTETLQSAAATSAGLATAERLQAQQFKNDAQAAANAASGAVTNPPRLALTLTALQASTPTPSAGAMGEVYGTGTDRGRYRYVSGAWTFLGPLLEDTQTSVATLSGALTVTPAIGSPTIFRVANGSVQMVFDKETGNLRAAGRDNIRRIEAGNSVLVIPCTNGELVLRCDPKTGYLQAAGFGGYDRVNLPGVPIVLRFANGEVPCFINPVTGALTAAGMGSNASTGGGGTGAGPDLGAFTLADRDVMEEAARDHSSKLRRQIAVLAKPDKGLCAIMLIGQSLAHGTTSYPRLTRSQAAPDCFMLGNSVHPQNLSGSSWAPIGDPMTLSPLVATVTSGATGPVTLLSDAEVDALPFDQGNRGETPGEGFCAQFRPAWLRSRGKIADPANKWVVGEVAVGGTSIEQWLTGAQANYINRARDYYRAVKAYAAANGLEACAPIIFIANGETSPNSSFAANLALFIAQLRALVAEEFPGQQGLVAVYLQQVGGSYTSTATNLAQARAQIEVARTVPGVFLVSNNGAFPDKAPDNTHLTANGSRWIGNQWGKVATANYVLDQGWGCTRALEFRYRQRTLMGAFHLPKPPLTWAAHFRGFTQPARPDDAGIYAVDDVGVMELSAARIVGNRSAAWTLSRDVIGQLWIYPGWQDNGDGAPMYLADDDDTPLANEYAYVGGSQNPAENIIDLVGRRYDARNLCLADKLLAIAA